LIFLLDFCWLWSLVLSLQRICLICIIRFGKFLHCCFKILTNNF
jgi:hypothetical protein